MDLSKVFKHAVILAQNPGLRNDIQTKLKKLNLQISKSTGIASSAYDDLKNENLPCNIIFTDIKLNDAHAMQFLDTIRKDAKFSATHIIVMHNEDEIDEISDLLSFSLSGIIKKPFSIDFLAKYLHARMGRLLLYGNKLPALANDTAASYFESAKKVKIALKYYQEIENIVPNAQTFFDIGRIHLSLGNQAEAKEYFNQTLKENQNYGKIIAKLLATAGNASESQRKLDKIPPSALKVFPIKPSELSKSFYGMGIIKKAMVLGGSHGERVSVKNTLKDFEINTVQLEDSGQQGLRTLKNDHFDLIIVNIRMSDMNALQFLDAYKEHLAEENTNILLSLEEDLLDNLYLAMDIGIDGYLLKPFTPDKLAISLHTILLQNHMTVLSLHSRKSVKNAYFCLQLKNYEKGLEFIYKAISKNPEDGVAHMYCGMLLQYLGKNTESRDSYTAAAEKNADLAQVCQIVHGLIEKEKLREEQEKGKDAEDENSEEEIANSDIAFENEDETDEFDALDDQDDQDDQDDEFFGSNIDDKEDEDQSFIEHTDSDSDSDTTDTGFISNESEMDASDSEDISNDFENSTTESKSSGFIKALHEDDLDVTEKQAEISIDSSLNLVSSNSSLAQEDSESTDNKDRKKSTKSDDQQKREKREKREREDKSKNKEKRQKKLKVDLDVKDQRLPKSEKSEKSEKSAKPEQSKNKGKQKREADDQDFSPDRSDNDERNTPEQIELSPADELKYIDSVNSDFGLNSQNDATQVDLANSLSEESLSIINSNIPSESLEKMKSNLELGVSPAHFPMSGLVEQVSTVKGSNKKSTDALPVKNLGSEVTEWMPSLKFEKVTRELNKMGGFFKSKNSEDPAIDLDKFQAKPLKLATNSLINQSRLFSNRIIGTPEELDASLASKSYLDSVGRALANEDLLKDLEESDIVLPKNIKKLLKKAANQDDGDLFEEVGKKIIEEDHLDEIFSHVENKLDYHFAREQKDDTPEETYKVKPMINMLSQLTKTSQKLHTEYLRGKEKFEEMLPYFLKEADKDGKESIESLYRAMEIDHFSFESFKKIYSSLHHEGKDKLAGELLKKMSKTYMKNPILRENLSRFLLAIGDNKNAKEIMKISIKDKSSEGRKFNLFNLALISYKDQEYKEAIKWCDKLLSGFKHDLEAYNLQGASLRKIDKIKKSIATYKKGIKHHPDSFKLHHNLGLALKKIGSNKEAAQEFKLARELKSAQEGSK